MVKIILVFAFIIGLASCGYEYTCDHRFGDPSWNYSKVFHDQRHVIPSGVTQSYVYLTNSKLISFVCINLTQNIPEETKVAFESLFKRVSVKFEKPHVNDVTVDVLAMHHGY